VIAKYVQVQRDMPPPDHLIIPFSGTFLWWEGPQSNKIFCLFQKCAPPKPLTWYLNAFQIWLQIQGDIFDLFSAIDYSRDLMFPVLFNTESLQQGVANVWVMCQNSGLPFNKESK
jgi:hypothetical protein